MTSELIRCRREDSNGRGEVDVKKEAEEAVRWPRATDAMECGSQQKLKEARRILPKPPVLLGVQPPEILTSDSWGPEL